MGLSQAALNLDIVSWFIDPLTAFINKGELVEALVGQELLAYSDLIAKKNLFYWRNELRNRQAEVGYLVQLQENVVPIEVKSGTSLRIKSMRIFLDLHPRSSYGIRFSAHNFDVHSAIHTYPLYAVAKPLFDADGHMRDALMALVAD